MPSFGPFVELFSVDGIDMIGNLDNNAVAGLTPQAAQACKLVMDGKADGPSIAAVDERLFEYLSKGGFFEPDAKNEHPLGAYVHVTQRCNLNCVGCYSLSGLRNCAPDPVLSDLRRAFEQLARNGARSVNISGGEPFLRDDLVDVVRTARECGIAAVNVVTNGTIEGRFDLAGLAEWVASVTVSIDGPSADAPAYIRREQRFDTLMGAVRRLKAAGIAARILPTLHARNIEDVPAYIRLAKALEVPLSFSLLSSPPECGEMAELIPNAGQLEQLAELQADDIGLSEFSGPFGIALKAKRACGAGCRTLSVDVDGGVYPCHMLQSKRFLMGNVLDEDLAAILERSRGDVAEWLLPIEKIESCNACEYGLVCGGGCRARTINCGAGPAGEDPYCSLSKGFYERMFSALSANVSGR